MNLAVWEADLITHGAKMRFVKNRRKRLEKKWSEEEKQFSRSEHQSIISILDNITLTQEQEINFIGTTRITLDFDFSKEEFLSFAELFDFTQYFIYFRNKTCWEKRKVFISSVCFLGNGAKTRILFTQDAPPDNNIFTQN